MREETQVGTVEEVWFGGLLISFDDRALRPRDWTLLQSAWAAELMPWLPPGPVLELCSGVGHIGLAAVADCSRPLVCVERDDVAASYAVRNAARAGLAERVDVRVADLRDALDPAERFALVVADPPWVPSAEVERWPEDPQGAIDGGADGLAVARVCLEVAAGHLLSGGALLLQVGSVAQADGLREEAGRFGLELAEVRVGERGVVARYGPS
jgi:release factor glutamine methyltransferase